MLPEGPILSSLIRSFGLPGAETSNISQRDGIFKGSRRLSIAIEPMMHPPSPFFQQYKTKARARAWLGCPQDFRRMKKEKADALKNLLAIFNPNC